MKKNFLLAALMAAGITPAIANDDQSTDQLYKVGAHTIEMDADCVIHSVDGSLATLSAAVSGHMDFNLTNGGIAESEPWPNRHICKVYVGNDVRTINMKKHSG